MRTARPAVSLYPSFLHSGDVLRVLVRAVTVQGWTDAEEELEGVAEIIAVVAVERIGAVVDCGGSPARSNVRPTTQRSAFPKSLRGKAEVTSPASAEAPAWQATDCTDNTDADVMHGEQ